MKMITWNIRGLGRGEKKRALKDMIVKELPDLMFIQESKLSSVPMLFLKMVEGMRLNNLEYVRTVGSVRGLICLLSEIFFCGVIQLS